jgi:hypothetical protein
LYHFNALKGQKRPPVSFLPFLFERDEPSKKNAEFSAFPAALRSSNSREALKKTSFLEVFPWRRLYLRKLLYNKELVIFSEEAPGIQAGFPGVPCIIKN